MRGVFMEYWFSLSHGSSWLERNCHRERPVLLYVDPSMCGLVRGLQNNCCWKYTLVRWAHWLVWPSDDMFPVSDFQVPAGKMRQSDRGAELADKEGTLATVPNPENGMCYQNSFSRREKTYRNIRVCNQVHRDGRCDPPRGLILHLCLPALLLITMGATIRDRQLPWESQNPARHTVLYKLRTGSVVHTQSNTSKIFVFMMKITEDSYILCM